MIANRIFILFLTLTPLISGNPTAGILDSHTPAVTIDNEEEALTDTTLSLGIKSFTVEVIKPTIKPSNNTFRQQQLSAGKQQHDDINGSDTNLKRSQLSVQPTTHYLSTSDHVEKSRLTKILPSSVVTENSIPSASLSLAATHSSSSMAPLSSSSSLLSTSSSSLSSLSAATSSSSSSSSSSDTTLLSETSTSLLSQAIIEEDDNHVTIHSATEMGTESEIEQESTDERPPAPGFSSALPPITMKAFISPEYVVSTTTTIIPPTTITPEPMINDIHVEKKLENGLYRIKLAEIITDEFNGIGSSINDISSSSVVGLHEANQNQNFQAQSNSVGKINIIDLYPSKLEDFGPIIRDSNEKILRDKQTFLKDDKNTLSNSLSNNIFDTEKNVPASKIEIELIDGNDGNEKNTATTDKITDLTGKLQQQDGVITEIEKKFRLDDLKPPSPPPQKEIIDKPLTVNHKIEFIDRRVKKSFDFPQNQFGRRIDFANTKFNTEPVRRDEKDAHIRQGDKPEFSTTKFYNSKELYNEMLHRKVNSEISIKRLTTTSPFMADKFEEKLQAIKSTENKKPSQFSLYAVHKGTNTNIDGFRSNVSDKDNGISTKANNKAKTIPKSKITSVITLLKSGKENPNVDNVAPSTVVNDGTLQGTAVHMTSPSSPTVTMWPPRENKKSMYYTSSGGNGVDGGRDDGERDDKLQENINAAGVMLVTGTTTSSGGMLASSTVVTSTAAVITENFNPTSRTSAALKVDGSISDSTTISITTPKTGKPFSRPRVLTRLQEKINSLECDIQNLPQDSRLWRGNETHELFLPITTPSDCKTNIDDCSPMIISWEGQAEIQSGDVLLVEINDSLLTPTDFNRTQNNATHKASTTVYQVTRLGHEHCDVTEGGLLDITPLVVDGKKIVTLYDKDLTEGINLLIVVSELWGPQCVRLKVTVKSDNCGDNADCSGKGVCFSNTSMEGYECQCCQGFAGSHCEEIDACTPSPCTNNGICVDLSQGHEGNAYQCLCPYGYTGKNCQYESDPCNPAECLNGGSCYGNSTHFRCDCAPGYTGPLCQHNLNECESSPCVHGICVDQEDGFRCFCQPGFAGELCNFEYNECESNPCMNGGQCIDQIGGYECKCTRGYTGNQCHIKVDFCANGPCPEGHRCIDRGDDFTCECPSGTNGPDCIQVPRTLCNINQCANGGTCWTSEESFYCACRPGYTGKMCEDEFVVETVVSSSEFMVDDTNARSSFNDKAFGVSVSKSPIELHNAYIAAGTLATAIFIVAVVVTICHCKVNQTYRRFSTRHHQLIPIFGFGRRMKSPKSHRHWLSGKGGGGGGGGGVVGSGGNIGSNGNLVGHKTNKNHLPGTGVNGQCHNHHIGGGVGVGGGGGGVGGVGGGGVGGTPSYHNSHHQVPDRPFQRHLAMNLENDMYYTVDFSDSQHSPLIQ